MEIVDTTDAAWRATLGTSRREMFGEEIRLVPDFTTSMASDLLYREMEAAEPRPEDFSDLFRPGTVGWEDFFATRKVVKRTLPDGSRVAAVTSNIADVLRVEKELQTETGEKGRAKQYEVVHLLTDSALANKFSLKAGFAARMRNMAIVDTARAARELQVHIRSFEGYERAVVVVGKYAGSWKAARDSIKAFASRFPMTSVATDATFIGDKVFIYGTGEHDTWRVYGPAQCAALVLAVHKMVEQSSCESVMFAFGPELTLLDIDIHDGNETMCPIRECHAGSHNDLPLRAETEVNAHLSISQRQDLMRLTAACETLAVDGENVATAVRITGRYVLVNAHVVQEGGQITCNGEIVVPHRMLSKDLWLAKVRGEESAWHLRTPEVGEKVLLCYRRHNEMQMLGPVSVLSVASELLSMEKHPGMQAGMSGAAIVALKDFALLGLYDAVTMRKSLAAVFSPEMFTDVCTMSEQGDSSHASAQAHTEGSIYNKMIERGMGKVVDAAMAASVALYSGEVHVGMGFSRGAKVYTTCDPDLQPLSLGVGEKPLVFNREGCFYSAQLAASAGAGPAVTRSPSYGESVFVVGKDAEGEYFSSTDAKVVHVGVGAATFQVAGLDPINALPLTGGLILSSIDAAVLGAYDTCVFDKTRGQLTVCRSLPEEKTPEPQERPEAAIQRVFPFLRPGAWPEGVAEAVITHSSTGKGEMGAYAMVGDSAMRTLLMVRLLESKLPTSKWSGFAQRDQCNSAQASACERLGLHTVVRVGGGLSLVSGSKVYADLLEAVAGAVHLHEPVDVFETFCEAAGVIRSEYELGEGG